MSATAAATVHNPAQDAKNAAECPKPETLGGLTAYLTVSSATGAADFYQKAFAGKLVGMYPPDDTGRTMHVHLHINGTSLMLSDAYPEHGHPLSPPAGFNLTLHVRDIDTWFSRAVAAGAQVVMPVQKMFWGDRYGQLRDPYGVMWSLNEAAN
jgi:PhnB protein